MPDFGGFYHDSARDKAGPDINLRDLDNDGDLDLIQSYHCDVLDLAALYSPIEYRQGVFCWKNLLAETGTLRFEKVTGNGLACEARLKLSPDKKRTAPIGKAPGLHGGKENHWLRLRFRGVTDAELIGARVEVTAPGMKQHRWIHPHHSYKSGGALEAHFGLSKAATADVKVALPSGETVALASVKADQFLDLNLRTSQSTIFAIAPQP